MVLEYFLVMAQGNRARPSWPLPSTKASTWPRLLRDSPYPVNIYGNRSFKAHFVTFHSLVRFVSVFCLGIRNVLF